MTHLRPLHRPDTVESLAQTLARDPRAYTLPELSALWSEGKARAAVARGEVVRLLPNAYVAAIHAESFAARTDAALLWAGPNAAVTGVAALFLWGLVDRPPTRIEISLPHAERPHPPHWLQVRRVTYPVETRRVGRAPVVSPEHAVIVGFASLPRDRRAAVVFAAVARRLTTADRLAEVLAEVPRCRARRELLARIDAAAQGAESHLEERGLRTVFNTRDFSGFIRQHRVRVDGEFFRLDMYDAATMLDVELDGAAFHSSPEQRQRDVHRDAMLATVGIQTLRLTYEDITRRPEWCRWLVLQVRHSRRRSVPRRGR